MVLLDIKKIVQHLQKKYQSNSPFEIAASMGILVVREELGSIRGYYNKVLRQQQIHINCNLDEHAMIYTAAHELGHAILHPDSNTPFLFANTYLSVNKLEMEANKFAMELLICDERLSEFSDSSIESLSRIFGYQERLIELRLK